jgi:hypothetical protein
MDNDHIKVMFGSIIQQLFEKGSTGDGFNVGGFTLFTIDLDWFPSPALA